MPKYTKITGHTAIYQFIRNFIVKIYFMQEGTSACHCSVSQTNLQDVLHNGKICIGQKVQNVLVKFPETADVEILLLT